LATEFHLSPHLPCSATGSSRGFAVRLAVELVS
jgi:hypothetical protein